MLTKSKVEYIDLNWNFYEGCLNYEQGYCPLKRCWARGMARFRGGDFTPHLITERLLDPLTTKHKPSQIGVCFTGDLFGDWVDPEQPVSVDVTDLLPGALPMMTRAIDHRVEATDTLKHWVFHAVSRRPADTFIFPTKCPHNLLSWSPFPSNAYVGASVTNDRQLTIAWKYLRDIRATVKFLSIEPLLSWEMNVADLAWTLETAGVSWLVLGQQTPIRASTMPKIEWVREIVQAADKASIPVYLKNNLRELLCRGTTPWAWQSNAGVLRQELPEVKK